MNRCARLQREMDLNVAKRKLKRGLRLKCPNCGLGSLYRSPFRMNPSCLYCDLVFEREQGYFIGAVYINVIATETTLLLTVLIYGLITGTITTRILTILFVLALALPLIFFHHSRSLWLAIDHILNPEKVSREV
jgi:uncharacterized protein (DUF983 family)